MQLIFVYLFKAFVLPPEKFVYGDFERLVCRVSSKADVSAPASFKSLFHS